MRACRRGVPACPALFARLGPFDVAQDRLDPGSRFQPDGTAEESESRVEPGMTVAQFTESFSSLPALNLGLCDALIVIGSPVRGLRPVEALRRDRAKVPKPTSRTSTPV